MERLDSNQYYGNSPQWCKQRKIMIPWTILCQFSENDYFKLYAPSILMLPFNEKFKVHFWLVFLFISRNYFSVVLNKILLRMTHSIPYTISILNLQVKFITLVILSIPPRYSGTRSKYFPTTLTSHFLGRVILLGQWIKPAFWLRGPSQIYKNIGKHCSTNSHWIPEFTLKSHL